MNQPENTVPAIVATKKDYKLALVAGLLIGALLLPITKTANQALYDIIYLAIIPFFAVATPLGLRIAYFISQRIAIVWQIAKFGLIGLLNTLVDIGSLALINVVLKKYFNIYQETTLLEIGVLTITIYSVYKAISFIIANINSYFWNKYWTFEASAEKKSKGEFVQFFVVSLIGFIINIIVASYVFGSIASSLNSDQWGLIGAAAGSIFALVWNFIGYKFWVFKK